MRQLAYSLLIIIASPALLAGYALLLLRGAGEMRRSGLSATAINPLYGRALLHRLGLRPDPVAAAILRRVPYVPRAGRALLNGPLYWATRLTAWYPVFLRYDVAAARSPSGLVAGRIRAMRR